MCDRTPHTNKSDRILSLSLTSYLLPPNLETGNELMLSHSISSGKSSIDSPACFISSTSRFI